MAGSFHFISRTAILTLSTFLLTACGGSGTLSRYPEICDNGIDDDRDGYVDCDDQDCWNHPHCTGNPAEEICDNGMDDDGDGLVDCDDPDCEEHPYCTTNPVEICDNGMDDDGDGLVDCDDPDCEEHPYCTTNPVEICDNGMDDDGDDLVDCDDPDCDDDPACAVIPPELCDNGIDDNDDGLVDCDDPDCATERSCLDYTGEIGAACRTAADCTEAGAGAVCLSEMHAGYPGGLCVTPCTLPMCPTGSTCVTSGMTSHCMKTCEAATDCRFGYQCSLFGNSSQAVCNPRCRRDWQCRDTRWCNTSTNLCVAREICHTPEDDDNDGAFNCDDSDCAGDVACGCQDDGRNNVQVSTAWEIGLSSLEPIDGRICGPTYTDWFVFTPSTSVTIRFFLAFSHADGDLDMYLYRSSNILNSLAYGYTNNDNEEFTHALEAGQTYYLTVEGFHRASNAYTLTLSVMN